MIHMIVISRYFLNCNIPIHHFILAGRPKASLEYTVLIMEHLKLNEVYKINDLTSNIYVWSKASHCVAPYVVSIVMSLFVVWRVRVNSAWRSIIINKEDRNIVDNFERANRYFFLHYTYIHKKTWI